MLGNRLAALLVAPWFWLATATLIVNDALLKQLAPGLVTGKLSDFAGLLVVGALAGAFAGNLRRALPALLLAALTFAWWKSTHSQGFIALAMRLGIAIGRTVDLIDLVALPMLPLGAALAERLDVTRRRSGLPRRLLVGASGTAVIFGITATSMIPMRDFYDVRTSDPAALADIAAIEQRVIEAFAAAGFERCPDCDTNGPITYLKGTVTAHYVHLPAGRGLRFEITKLYGSPVGWGDGREDLDELQKQLRRSLIGMKPDLQLVVELIENDAIPPPMQP